MPLTDISARNAKPKDKDYKLADSGGLYLLVRPNGSRLWRQKYRFRGVEKTLSHGAYPTVGLAAARERRDLAKALLEQGRDPGETKQAAKKANGDTFKAWALAWFANRSEKWSPDHAKRVKSRIENDAFPAFGAMPVSGVERKDVLAMLRAIEERGAITMAKRLKGYCSDIFDYAIGEGAAASNPVNQIGRNILRPNPRTRHMHKLPVKDFPEFFRKLNSFQSERTRLAIRLTLLTWARTSETRFATLPEFEQLDGDAPLWRIPPERMKKDREHLVPLSRQAVAVVRRLIDIAGGNESLFQGRGPEEAMSQTTMLQALYTMGYKGRATIHGLRGVASTWANESLIDRNGAMDRKYDPDWVEMALAHSEDNEVRGAYNAAQYLGPRRQMLQDWADQLDEWEHGDSFESLLA